jgi:hypothetical protein
MLNGLLEKFKEEGENAEWVLRFTTRQ